MNRLSTLMAVCLLGLLGGVVGLGMRLDEGEPEIPSSEVPGIVLETIRKHTVIDRVIEADRVSRDGAVVYEIEIASGDRVFDFEVRADGTLLQMVKDGAEDVEGDEKLAIEDLPAEVMVAYLKLSGGVMPVAIDRDVDDGITTYELEFERNGVKSTVVLTERGESIAFEDHIDAATLPQAVREAIAKRYPSATIEEAESVQTFAFEVELKIGDRSVEVVVLPNGAIPDDDDGDDDEDEGEGDDD